MKPITAVAESLGIPAEFLHSYGPHMAKVQLALLDHLPPRQGKLVLVTGITPTVHGEGKTVTTIGLTQALAHIGKKSVATLRQPSLGPVFGQKGGATGGGLSQVLPHDRINVHFTGDFHAVAAARIPSPPSSTPSCTTASSTLTRSPSIGPAPSTSTIAPCARSSPASAVA